MREIISQLFSPPAAKAVPCALCAKPHTLTHIADKWLREWVCALQVANHGERPEKVSDTVNSLMLIN